MSVCVCVCVCVVYEDTNLYNDMGIFSVPIIQKAYKSYRITFFLRK